MRKSKQRIDKITVEEAEIADSQYAVFLQYAEQLSTLEAKAEYLKTHLYSLTRLATILGNKVGLSDYDRNSAAGAFFAIWFFGHGCLNDRYIDDILNECFRLLLPSTCISYFALLEDINRASAAIVKVIEKLETQKKPKVKTDTQTSNNIDDIF